MSHEENLWDPSEDFNESSIKNYIKTISFGKDLEFHKKTESTQPLASQKASKGASEGTVVVADEQTKGRGRHNYTWESPKGVNLYFSLVFRPQNPFWPVSRGNEIQYLTAISAANVLEKECGVSIELKWPNDLKLNGKKLGGIILSTAASSPQKIESVVMGMGININSSEKDFGPEVKNLATSIFIEKRKKLNRSLFLALLLKEIERQYLQLLLWVFRFIFKPA